MLTRMHVIGSNSVSSYLQILLFLYVLYCVLQTALLLPSRKLQLEEKFFQFPKVVVDILDFK